MFDIFIIYLFFRLPFFFLFTRQVTISYEPQPKENVAKDYNHNFLNLIKLSHITSFIRFLQILTVFYKNISAINGLLNCMNNGIYSLINETLMLS